MQPLCACLLLLALCACQSMAPETPLRVMSFNVRVPVDADGPDRWELRRDAMVRTIRDADPDLLGTQELVRAQGEFLAARLPQYAWFGRSRGAGDDDEQMAVFYRRDAMRLLESGHFWLSDTPEVAGSISWGHPYPRMATWGLFERRTDRQRFYLFNTHLPYRAEDGAARVRGAELVLRRLAELPPGVPVIVVGDFNDTPGSAVHRALTGALQDAWIEAPRREGPEGTFHGFTGDAGKRIDWVMHRGLRVRLARTLDRAVDGRLPSDHFPLLVEFEPAAVRDGGSGDEPPH
ncbi:endonuclease/exonuclease/phosphatase family protein [Luteimonas viscosa]|uniref:Endonuclease/exonuclease/phosphatase family protein n=1 Tax=Luteimonas viscosa TaxID=1132694 RepID=A0A5D4XL61_9GAMM|nr:endonuclease/exonuclease/phosphatase family protein [Luteimonas viscosa]TYT24864.1 endonuclease/exonuclease/phosphatase family protein [Luteimonas viscosa]